MSDVEEHYSTVADTLLAPLRASDPTRKSWPLELQLLDMACGDAREWWLKHRDLLAVRTAARRLALYADECALILKVEGYPAKAQSLESKRDDVIFAITGTMPDTDRSGTAPSAGKDA